MYGGYVGRLLLVNLTKRQTEVVPVQALLCENFLGGYGFGVSLIYDWQKPRTDR